MAKKLVTLTHPDFTTKGAPLTKEEADQDLIEIWNKAKEVASGSADFVPETGGTFVGNVTMSTADLTWKDINDNVVAYVDENGNASFQDLILTGSLNVSGAISGSNINSDNWDQAYNDSIVSMSMSSSGILTLTQRDGDELTTNFFSQDSALYSDETDGSNEFKRVEAKECSVVAHVPRFLGTFRVHQLDYGASGDGNPGDYRNTNGTIVYKPQDERVGIELEDIVRLSYRYPNFDTNINDPKNEGLLLITTGSGNAACYSSSGDFKYTGFSIEEFRGGGNRYWDTVVRDDEYSIQLNSEKGNPQSNRIFSISASAHTTLYYDGNARFQTGNGWNTMWAGLKVQKNGITIASGGLSSNGRITSNGYISAGGGNPYGSANDDINFHNPEQWSIHSFDKSWNNQFGTMNGLIGITNESDSSGGDGAGIRIQEKRYDTFGGNINGTRTPYEIYVYDNEFIIACDNTSDFYFKATGSEASLFYGHSKVLYTTQSAVVAPQNLIVDGSITAGTYNFPSSSITLSDNVSISGEASSSGLLRIDNEVGTNSGIEIEGNSGNTWTLKSDGNLEITNETADEVHLRARNTGETDLFFEGSRKLTTTNTGIDVIGSVNEISDRRIKTDTKPITNALDSIRNIDGYLGKKNGVPFAGYIAQNVEEYTENVVTKKEALGYNDLRNMSLMGMQAYNTMAIKEVDSEMMELKKENEELKNKVDSMENELKEIKKLLKQQ